ncbi:MAG TPA: EAL domain-containing protein [Thiobacillaceae bacterium]|nr:EAL domain-containing protein [Thiobacillaceae bacterium]HNU65210.1 EAL domain-containing protein [Thiobacillaceae bacterium]
MQAFSQAHPSQPARVSLLIVDDEPRYLDSTRLLLTPVVDGIDTALDGAQAYARLEQRLYDLALLDLHLPDTTGHDIMAWLRIHQPQCRVIITSGDDHIEAAIQSLRLGAYDYLRKPYEPEELIQTLRNVVGRIHLERDNRRLQQQIEHSEEWYRLLVNNSPDIIYTLDARGSFTFLNESVRRTLGYSPEELIGQDYLVLVPPGEIDHVRHRFNDRRTGNRATRNYEMRLRRKDDLLTKLSPHAIDNQVIVELSAMGMYRAQPDGDEEFLGTYGVARDVSERKQAEATITFQAYHDQLTSLPNRTLFHDRLGQAMVQAKRHAQNMAIMFLDLDRFKVVNDTLGHPIGDSLLQAVAQRLKACLREGDTLSRIGGDEFMLLLPLIHSRENVIFIAEKILSALKTPFNIEGHEIFIGVSIGIALYPEDGDNRETLIKHADIAMYHAKDHGRNNFKFFTHALNKALSGRLSVENDMRRALQEGQFQVYYQPQVDIESRRIRGMEALIRWQHPRRGLVLPDDFISIAEDCGLINPISDWVLGSICRQANLWAASRLPIPTLAVNVSPRQIEHPHFVDRFMEILLGGCARSDAIEVEITESALMRDVDGAIGKLRKLADQGVNISIDDFGTGYSSLSYLKKLPIHTLKIDRSFVQDLFRHQSGATIVAGIAAMAKGLKLHVVAEGVETEEQLNYLRELGCDAYQGFYFSHPVDAGKATEILSAQLPG